MALEQKEREGACTDHAKNGSPITIFILHVYICAQTCTWLWLTNSLQHQYDLHLPCRKSNKIEVDNAYNYVYRSQSKKSGGTEQLPLEFQFCLDLLTIQPLNLCQKNFFDHLLLSRQPLQLFTDFSIGCSTQSCMWESLVFSISLPSPYPPLLSG